MFMFDFHYVYVCVCVHMCADAHRGQKGESDSLVRGTWIWTPVFMIEDMLPHS